MDFYDIKVSIIERWGAISAPAERIFWLYLISALILAFLSWAYYRYLVKTKKPEKTSGDFFSYVFDKDVYLHRSAIQDYAYFFINAIFTFGIIAQLLLSSYFFMMAFYHLLGALFGVHEEALLPSSLWTLGLYTVISALFLDFAVFITHYAQHKIPILWEFHKVHHSAEVLNPVTFYRMHPVDLFLTGLVAALLAGLAFAGFFYLTNEVPTVFEVMGLNIIVFIFYIFGYNLRHSQIWLSYPVWISHFLVSPAQHQIHHSTDTKHYDKNLGLIFAFWDKLFGTLYIPKGFEKLSYGINKKNPNPFRNVKDMYIQPFQNAWKLIRPNKETHERAVTFLFVFVFCMAGYILFLAIDKETIANTYSLASVNIEDLTWTEIQDALDNHHYKTVIIPTGGTEQNGAHIILGKHNYIIRHNAEEIARQLGNAMVAPVISYVPEDMHMEWAGTITIPEDTFESLLEATAESFISHGFKNILFLGDSYGNQPAQEKIAKKLSDQWQDKGIIVAHISDYYSGNGQMQWLLDHGYSKIKIGGHAGIRDTSEMLFIHPEGFRRNLVLIDGRVTGNDGDYHLAKKKIGKKNDPFKN